MNKTLFSLLMLLVASTATAHDIEVANTDGKTIYYVWTNNQTELAVSYRGSSYSAYSSEYSGNVVVPSSVSYGGNTYSVTSIGVGAFESCSGLTSIEIPNSVTSIGGSAFSGCSGLTSIYVDSSNSKYDSRNSCNAIIETASNTLIAGCKNTTIPNSVTSIDTYAFAGCSGLTSITIPNSVTSIGVATFLDCSGLTSIEIPNSVTSIGDHAFESCSGLTTITIPNSVTSIGVATFQDCSGLTSITIPNSVTSIGNAAFFSCSGLTSITIPNSVTSIGNAAFDGTAWYENQPDGLVYAGKVAYTYKGTMPANTSISLQEGTLGISGSAFYNCSGLTSITIPNSVTSIDKYAFDGCSALTNVKVDRETPPSIYFYTFTYSANATLYVPAGSKAAYEAADNWKYFKRIIECVDGDVNGDGESDVVDVVDIARYVVGTPAETFVEILADINNNGEVNIADAVCLVNDIAGDQNFAKPMGSPSKPETTSDALMLTQGSNGLSLLLENQRYYTAFQFDLYVPEGVDVMQMMLNAQRKQKHQLLYNKVEEGHWRVAALSTSNRTFADNSGELLRFTLAGNANGDIVVSDIHFFTPDGEDCTFNDIQMKVGVATDIQTAGNPQQTADNPDVYDLSGRKIENSKWSNRQLPKGIYIVNGKKVIIK